MYVLTVLLVQLYLLVLKNVEKVANMCVKRLKKYDDVNKESKFRAVCVFASS